MKKISPKPNTKPVMITKDVAIDTLNSTITNIKNGDIKFAASIKLQELVWWVNHPECNTDHSNPKQP